MKKNIKKIIVVVVSLLIALTVVVTAIVSNLLYTNVLTYKGASRMISEMAVMSEDEREEAASFFGSQGKVDSWLKTDGYEVSITSRDELRLHAYMVKTKTQSHKYAIICHGYTATGSTMTSFASHFYSMNFNVILPDARGHGQSEGDYIGMGWPERLDMIDWIEYIVSLDPSAEILLFGISMGGATVMMTAGEQLPKNVKLIIEDCGYSSVWDEFYYQMNKVMPIPSFPFLYTASLTCKIRAGYSFKEASAVEQVKKNTTIPMLFIHGEDDDFVPYSMLDEVYNAAACPKQKYTVPKAGHAMASFVEPIEYWNTVEGFVKRYM